MCLMVSVGLLGDVVGVVRLRMCVRAAPCLFIIFLATLLLSYY